MTHIEEYKRTGTCAGWSEEHAKQSADWSVNLMFKDVHGKTSIVEQVALKLDALLAYNDVVHIPEEEVLEKAQEIINHIKNQY